jgi:hypothetical protein
MAADDDGGCCVELVAFSSPAYVYQVPPARTAAGHRCVSASLFLRFSGVVIGGVALIDAGCTATRLGATPRAQRTLHPPHPVPALPPPPSRGAAAPTPTPPSCQQALLRLSHAPFHPLPTRFHPLPHPFHHSAEDWDVNKWLAEVTCRLLTRTDDSATIRLEDATTGELFAACPIPASAASSHHLGAIIEAVVDSSRYFVLRVADEASGRHAFLGLGFRSRDAASDFKMALSDHERAVGRSAEAARRHAAAEGAAEGEGGAGGGNAADVAGAAPVVALRDLSLKEGAKITVSVPVR